MITACRAGSSTVLYWSESTPIARLFAAAAAWKTPRPEPPAGVEDDVGAGVVHALRHDLALGRVVEAGEVTGSGEMYWVSILMPGLTALAPAT